MSHALPLLSLLVAGLLGACAASSGTRPQIGDEVHYAQGAVVPQLCFSHAIDGFSDSTDSSVVVHRGARQRYLLRTHGYCQDLAQARSLALRGRSSCLSPGDSIVVQRYFPGLADTALGASNCRIRSIHEWVARGDGRSAAGP